MGTVRRAVFPGQSNRRLCLGSDVRVGGLAPAGEGPARRYTPGRGSGALALDRAQLPRLRPTGPGEVEPRLRTVPVAMPQPDGLIQEKTFHRHPYASAGRERQEYKTLGE